VKIEGVEYEEDGFSPAELVEMETRQRQQDQIDTGLLAPNPPGEDSSS